MVLWGVILGAVLGLAWPGHDEGFRVMLGAVLGGIAGATLRSRIRSEVQAALAEFSRQQAARAPAGGAVATSAPVAAPSPAATLPPAFAQDEAAATPSRREVPAEDFTETLPAAPAAEPRAPTPPPPPDLASQLVARARAWLFGGNTVVRMGVLVLFVGLAFLAKYAVDNALLPPALRLAAIAAAGIALFVAGFRLRRRGQERTGYALTLQGAGVAVLYLTVFAAFRLYALLPPGFAFAALALVCAFSAAVALLQNAQAMAFIGFAGGFAAPILVSTGRGDHVGLFSYYALLGVAIAAIAWLRAWRALNLLGFFATFGVATAWGALRYGPELFASTEPFLVAFFAIYLAATLAYALRHSLAAKQAVDATLVFGVPIAAFGLQAALVRPFEFATAFSALALGALYLALGLLVARPRAGRSEVHRWLAECFLALGLGFATLAVPLALDARWTSAVWAIEGAGVYWMGRRQHRWLARAAGLLLQALAAGAFVGSPAFHARGGMPFSGPAFIGAVLLGIAAFAIAALSRERREPTGHAAHDALAAFEFRASPFFLWAAFLWWQFAWHAEIDRLVPDAGGDLVPRFAEGLRTHLQMIAWVATAFALHRLARPKRTRPWAAAATPAWTVLPALLAWSVWDAAMLPHVFASGGWFAWPLVLGLHLAMLRALDTGPPARWWPWVHAGGVWLVVVLLGNLLVEAIDRADLWRTAWASVILLVASTLVLFALGRAAGLGTASRARARWPLDRFARAYVFTAAAPLAACVALGALVVAVASSGEARPLPYVPLLNPTDLAVGLALLACAGWLLAVRNGDLPLPAAARSRGWPAAVAAIAFIAVNTVWLRVVHHYAGVAWDAGALFGSFLVQAGYSILWTTIALAVMVASHRRALRAGWMAGAALLGLTVLKLFVIDLSNRGGSERIVVFISVGILMLVVGWLAPMPPQRRVAEGAAS